MAEIMLATERKNPLEAAERIVEDAGLRILKGRESDGIAVVMAWDAGTNKVDILVYDTKHTETFLLQPEGEQANMAFHHPYAFRMEENHAKRRAKR